MSIPLCTPTIIYVVFAGIQIILDVKANRMDIVKVKLIISIIFACLLEILCRRGMGLISWILVFVPFAVVTMVGLVLKKSEKKEEAAKEQEQVEMGGNHLITILAKDN